MLFVKCKNAAKIIITAKTQTQLHRQNKIKHTILYIFFTW